MSIVEKQRPRFQRILRLPDVRAATGKSTTAIYMEAQAGKFPAPISIGPRAVGWLEDELIEWQEKLIARRDAKSAA
jgi:prophage regulatory protein